MVGGRRDRRLNGGGNGSGAMMWLYVERQWGQCIMSNDVAVCRRNRG